MPPDRRTASHRLFLRGSAAGMHADIFQTVKQCRRACDTHAEMVYMISPNSTTGISGPRIPRSELSTVLSVFTKLTLVGLLHSQPFLFLSSRPCLFNILNDPLLDLVYADKLFAINMVVERGSRWEEMAIVNVPSARIKSWTVMENTFNALSKNPQARKPCTANARQQTKNRHLLMSHQCTRMIPLTVAR